MIFQRFCQAIDYRITGGGDYLWHCYGTNVYSLDSDFLDQYSASLIFDRDDQTCYELTVCDYINNRAYRWVDPAFKSALEQECQDRRISTDHAWDEVAYTDLEVLDDFFEKLEAISQGREYDTRVSVPVDLDNDILFDLMMRAHKQDITFNQMVENVLRSAIADIK
jgi:hypothetical protein